jgi:excisionase family DNA binding protein
MNNSYQEEDLLSQLSISAIEGAAIKQRADRVGKQIGEAVSSFLAEIMISILATRPHAVFPVSQAGSQGPDGILKASDVAQILRISKGLAYRMMQQGEIPAIQFGRTTRVRRQDLDEFIRAHRK